MVNAKNLAMNTETVSIDKFYAVAEDFENGNSSLAFTQFRASKKNAPDVTALQIRPAHNLINAVCCFTVFVA